MIVADLLQLRKITEAEKQTLDLTYPLIIAIENTESIVGGCHRRSSHRHSCHSRPVCTPKPVYFSQFVFINRKPYFLTNVRFVFD